MKWMVDARIGLGAPKRKAVHHRTMACAAWLVGALAFPALALEFPNGGLDEFSTWGIFKVVELDGTSHTSPAINDANTIVGRSDPFTEGAEPPGGVPIVGWDPNRWPNTSPNAPDPWRFPGDFPEGPAARREVHTEILDLDLGGGGLFSVKAGQAFWDNASEVVRQRFYRDSFGEVASHNSSGIPAQDFPADSFFNVFVQVTVGLDTYYNLTPMVLRARSIGEFPPEMTLPKNSYIHDPRFPAVPLFDECGIHKAYLMSAGHGGPVTGTTLPDAPDAHRFLTSANFTVDAASTGVEPTHVWVDRDLPEQQVTVYNGGEESNARVDALTGTIGTPPEEFQDGDAIRSSSNGRDGTCRPDRPQRATEGVLYFSVGRDSQGKEATDVWFSAQALVPRQAGSVYVSGVSPFGRYVNEQQVPVPSDDNFLALDSTGLGLRPSCLDDDQDNVTSLEVSDFDPDSENVWYGTYTGPSFDGPGQGATIWVYQDANEPFIPEDLDVFAEPNDLGLDPNDVIDALVLSDVSVLGEEVLVANNGVLDELLDEALFSLAPDSPTLLTYGYSAADIFYSAFDGTFSVFASAEELGLLAGDNVDSIDIAPIPEPVTLVLLALAGLGIIRRRR